MSTKTTFKRISLVTVAALGLGVVASVAPASAGTYYAAAETPFVVTVADTVVGAADYNSTTGVWDSGTAAAAVAVTQVAGAGNFVQLTAKSDDTTTATAVTVTVTGTTLSVATQGTDTFTVNTAGTVATSAGYQINNAAIRVLVPAVGTYTATVSKVVVKAGISTITDQQVFTITGVAAATRGVISVANSKSYITDSATVLAAGYVIDSLTANTIAADATILKAKTTAPVAAVKVTLKDGQVTPAAVASKELVAVVSGSGLVSAWGSSTGARVASATTNASGVAGFFVYGDGTAGVGTITITQGTTVIATETVTFTGTVAAIAATPLSTVVSTTNNASIADAFEIKATDAAGNLVTGLTGFTATSSDAAVLSSAITVREGDADTLAAGDDNGPGYYYVTVSSAAAGTIASGAKATITVKYTISSTSSVSTSAVPFTTGGAVIYGATLTSDVASVSSGEKVTLTLAATDKAGNPIADGTYVVFDTATATAGALTSSQTLTSKLFGTGSIAFLNGKATSSFYAPASKVTISGKLSAGAAVAAALNSTAITPLVVDVTNAAVDAATDAANEAAQAASDATDAALAAADAADAATTKAQEAVDAVATLSAQVSKLITALKAQITTLTNLVIKIQKKVKA